MVSNKLGLAERPWMNNKEHRLPDLISNSKNITFRCSLATNYHCLRIASMTNGDTPHRGTTGPLTKWLPSSLAGSLFHTRHIVAFVLPPTAGTHFPADEHCPQPLKRQIVDNTRRIRQDARQLRPTGTGNLSTGRSTDRQVLWPVCSTRPHSDLATCGVAF